MSSAGKVTYTYDQVAVITVKVTTSEGPAVARTMADGLLSMEVSAFITDLDVGPEVQDMDVPWTVYDLACVAPRFRAALVYAVDAEGEEVAVADDILWNGLPEPVCGEHREEAVSLVTAARKAADGDSGDAEYEAMTDLACFVENLFSIKDSEIR